MEKATFAAGCFWGVEAAFRQVPGVTATRVGFAGGSVPNPSYRQVCTKQTGHAEAVEVIFDPARVSYEELLDLFWSEHDPTTKDRQGWDVGPQYRSAIFFHTPEQEAAARASRDEVQTTLGPGRTVVTEIEAAPEFYDAEDYHQQYFEKMGRATCTPELGQAAAGGADPLKVSSG